MDERNSIVLGAGTFRARTPVSALTHFIGFICAIFGTPILLIESALNGGELKTLISLTVFMVGMILMYGASTAYHTFDLSDRGCYCLKKIDHTMISVMIAGSYTPICVLVLEKPAGNILLAVIWGLAIAGIALKLLWINCPKWVSSVLYITMGWACAFAIPMLVKLLPTGAFLWLLTGGLLYTAGGVIYALKISVLEKRFKDFGSHELFHIFIMGGTFCHYMMMFLYIA